MARSSSLGSNGGAAGVGVDRCLNRPFESTQRFVDQRAGIGRNGWSGDKVLQLGHREQHFLHRIGSAHGLPSRTLVEHGINNDPRANRVYTGEKFNSLLGLRTSG